MAAKTDAPETKDWVGKRIRALRGNATQAHFAEKIGVSRAALANYETGRTKPNDMTVLKIANLTGVSPSSIVSDEVYSFDDLAALVSAKPELKSLGDLSEDEKAMIRLIRVCDKEAIQQIVGAILEEIQVGRFNKEAVDVLNFARDYSRLAVIRECGACTEKHCDVSFIE